MISSPPKKSRESDEENPWTTLGSKIVYKNPWITVREDKVIRPDGKEGIYGVVDTRIATAVVALTPEQEVYLIGQYRYSMNEYTWELIEGGSDPGEDPKNTAIRELREEAGLVAGEFIQLGLDVHVTNCHSSERAYFYLARNLTEVPSEPEGTEVLKIKKVPFAAAVEMVYSNEIKDSLTIMGLVKAEHFLRCKKKCN